MRRSDWVCESVDEIAYIYIYIYKCHVMMSMVQHYVNLNVVQLIMNVAYCSLIVYITPK
jgi:hypothetical protein